VTNDDILRMALEADAYGEHGLFYMFAQKRPEVFVRFAALVAAAEREACAKVCEAISIEKWELYKGRSQGPGRASDFTQGQCDGADLCEQAIRARNTST
jgi:hypothetical protein